MFPLLCLRVKLKNTMKSLLFSFMLLRFHLQSVIQGNSVSKVESAVLVFVDGRSAVLWINWDSIVVWVFPGIALSLNKLN